MKKLTPEQKEFKLQLAVVRHLDIYYKGKCEYLHIPNRPGDATDGYFKKLMGAKAGAADLMITWRDWDYGILHCAMIELKAPDGEIKSAQNKFLSRYAHLGWNTAVCKSVREVHTKLDQWGIKINSYDIKEPDYSTWEDKVNSHIDAFAPPKKS